jgi:hypothetical protein
MPVDDLACCSLFTFALLAALSLLSSPARSSPRDGNGIISMPAGRLMAHRRLLWKEIRLPPYVSAMKVQSNVRKRWKRSGLQ